MKRAERSKFDHFWSKLEDLLSKAVKEEQEAAPGNEVFFWLNNVDVGDFLGYLVTLGLGTIEAISQQSVIFGMRNYLKKDLGDFLVPISLVLIEHGSMTFCAIDNLKYRNH